MGVVLQELELKFLVQMTSIFANILQSLTTFGVRGMNCHLEILLLPKQVPVLQIRKFLLRSSIAVFWRVFK
nr:hypothetical protein Iba_chr10fCG10760 [Ipomoea batatas]